MKCASKDCKLSGGFRQYKTMACVRDIFYVSPKEHRQKGRRRPFSGAFKQWVEWMEWSSMHGLEHFLIYTFEGTDLAAMDVMKAYLDSGIASRVHFQFYLPYERSRQGQLMNDCLYRAKNHAKWLVLSVDVDEYLVFPGKVKYFRWDHILKEQGVLEDKVASLQVNRVRFARAHPETFEISSDHRVPTLDPWRKTIINVDNVYRTWAHWAMQSKPGTAKIEVDPKLAIIHHYRWPWENFHVELAKYDFLDAAANVTDTTLITDMPLLQTALAKRFNISTENVQSFLTELAQRRPPISKALG
eukprot:s1362_g22.t1